eukprot:7758228-Pyramimonas_sp.AAC.1
MDIDKAFLKGLTYEELARATCEGTRMVCFALPPGSAQVLRALPGFSSYDEKPTLPQVPQARNGCKGRPKS